MFPKELLELRRAFRGGELQCVPPARGVVERTTSAALNRDLFVSKRLSPQLLPNVVDEEEDDGVIFEIVWNQLSNETVRQFVYESGLLCVLRIASSETHGLASESRTGRSFKHNDRNRPGLESKSCGTLHHGDDSLALSVPCVPILIGSVIESRRLRGNPEIDAPLLPGKRRCQQYGGHANE